MLRRPIRTPKAPNRRHWPTPSMVIAGAALFVALSGSAVAAGALIHTKDIATGAVTSQKIKDSTIVLKDLSAKTQASLRGKEPAGQAGPQASQGIAGANGANGANGPNGAAGVNGANGPSGIAGLNGTNGTNGTDGTNGVIAPLSATAGATALPTATPPTVVVALTVPARNYVVMAKTQLTHSGAGDTVDCWLKAGVATIDHVAIKTLPALASVPVSLQAVTTTSPTQLSVECDVTKANGSADLSSLMAIPIN
jgi:hypothetical protein